MRFSTQREGVSGEGRHHARRTQPLERANTAPLPSTHHPAETLPQGSHPEKPTPFGRRGSAWHPPEAPRLPEVRPPQKGVNYSARRDQSQFRVPVGGAAAKPFGMPPPAHRRLLRQQGRPWCPPGLKPFSTS